MSSRLMWCTSQGAEHVVGRLGDILAVFMRFLVFCNAFGEQVVHGFVGAGIGITRFFLQAFLEGEVRSACNPPVRSGTRRDAFAGYRA